MTSDLDIGLLRTFAAVAAWGSFAAGGPIAGCSPATASARVRALEARLGALELLLERAAGVNFYEVRWLSHRIALTRQQLE